AALSPALSYRHKKVQRLRQLAGRTSARSAERAFVVEGAKVLSEALSAGARVEAVYAAAGAPPDLLARAAASGARIHDLAPGVLERVSGTATPQPLIAVVPAVDVPIDCLRAARLVVVCVDLRDPGNAGTVLRSAEAAGAGGVLFCNGSVDVYNPKTVRASAGSLFHVPVVTGVETAVALWQLGEWGIRRLGAVASGGEDYTTVDLTGPTALVLGNEATGLPPGLAEAGGLDGAITIPMAGRSESLNVGMAAAVLCFEAARQRTATGRTAT
ncbi:MAG: TrmH family RNA methyltransferase, partial [Acidimicrobiales bacterium]